MKLSASLEQRKLLLPTLQQGLFFLQMPLCDLAQAVQQELAENPLLEWQEGIDDVPWDNDRSFGRSSQPTFENTLTSSMSLFDLLMAQARDAFSSAHQLEIAGAIIGNLSEEGFLNVPLEEIASIAQSSKSDVEAVLEKIQTFDPPGIAARSLQESLVVQLRQKSPHGLGLQIIQECFSHLVDQDFKKIAKKLKQPLGEIREAIRNEIGKLQVRPSSSFAPDHPMEAKRSIIPDLFFIQTHGELVVTVNKTPLPKFFINPHLVEKLKESHERTFLNEKVGSAKLLMRCLYERENTLLRIGERIRVKQRNFLYAQSGPLHPWTMRELASDLGLHESTIVRAISGKFGLAPRGIFSLRSLFTSGCTSESGEKISSTDIKGLIEQMISRENPNSPLSDEEISDALKQKNIVVARRTVAKYRNSLNLSSAFERKRRHNLL